MLNRRSVAVLFALSGALVMDGAGVCAPAHAAGGSKKKTPPPAPPPPAPDLKALNSLTLACSTPNADVYVDNEIIGKSPIDMPVPVSNGNHTIKVSKLGFAPYIDVFKAVPGKPVKLEVELIPVSGVLHVTSPQKEVRVLVDGKYVGDAPVDVEMDVGPHAVTATKAGYKEFLKNVLAVAGKDVEIEAKLEELPPELNPYVVKTPPPPRWYEKKWIWGVIAGGVVVVAGAVAGIGYAATRDPLGSADRRLPVPALIQF